MQNFETPTIQRNRRQSDYGNKTITLKSGVAGLSIKEDVGAGPVRQTTLQLTNVVLAITDDGATGHGSQELFTFPEGVITVMGGVQDLDITLSAGTTAQLAVGYAACNADSDLSDAGEFEFTAASTASATVANSFKAAGNDVRLNGTSTAAKAYLNLVTTGDPSSGATCTVNGTITITWRQDGM